MAWICSTDEHFDSRTVWAFDILDVGPHADDREVTLAHTRANDSSQRLMTFETTRRAQSWIQRRCWKRNARVDDDHLDVAGKLLTKRDPQRPQERCRLAVQDTMMLNTIAAGW